jgi:Asp-tRNA(Asn)/Glu-tRNA(Gln) amidotransferase A subunit family amidase
MTPASAGGTEAARTGQPDPAIAAAAATAARIADGDREIRAFLPEPKRADRLASDAAAAASLMRPDGVRPPLHGVAVGVKDVIRVDGLATRAGSRLPPAALAGPEATVVRRLREAGALIAGKTVTAEFAMVAPGPTRNPRDLRCTPGGSSSGSAAAVAAGLVPLALGTQTIGSVIRPAAFCGVPGYRPTHGRIPTAGVLPYAPTLDVVGCFAADVAGLVQTAAVLCDEWQDAAAGRLPVLGVPVGKYLRHTDDDALAAFDAQVQSLTAAGYQVREVAGLHHMATIERLVFVVTRYEAALAHANLFDRYRELYQPATAAVIREGQAISPDEYAAALAARTEGTHRLTDASDRAGVDIWITPAATGPAPASLASTGNPVMSMPWSLAGWPSVTIPAGAIGGLPLGLQCVAVAGRDERLLACAMQMTSVLASSGR